MSCGTKIEGRFYGWQEREEIAEKLEQDGEPHLADMVRRQQCLGFGDLYRANQALERQGMDRYFDYKEERCQCSEEQEQEHEI